MGEQRFIFGGAATTPSAVRASAAFWIASTFTSWAVPGIITLVRIGTHQAEWGWLELVGVAFGAPFAALQVWAALRLLRGTHWARVVLTLVAVFYVSSAVNNHWSVLPMVSLILAVAGSVLMWQPATNAFFQPQKELPASDQQGSR